MENGVTGYSVRWYDYRKGEHCNRDYYPEGLREALHHYDQLQDEGGHEGRVGAKLVMTSEQVLLSSRNDPRMARGGG